MKRLKIRTRMTLWFVLSSVAMTGILFLVLDAMVKSEMLRALREDLSLAVAQVSAQVWSMNRAAWCMRTKRPSLPAFPTM